MRRSHRRARIRNRIVFVGIAVALFAGGGWWYRHPRGQHSAPGGTPRVAQAEPAPAKVEIAKAPLPDPKPPVKDFRLVSDEQAVKPAADTPPPVSQPSLAEPPPEPEPPALLSQDPRTTPEDPTATRASDDTRTGNSTIEAARKLYDSGKILEARQELNGQLKGKLTGAEDAEVRALLTRIADETIFGKQVVSGDTLVESYVIQSGDVLINVGKKFAVPHEILMTINGIAQANAIRAGERLKIPRGPFHVKIHKSTFRLDVFLGDVYLRSYRVGLGTENGTPEGVWKVKNRLPNPTYYPPASASNKRIIPPGDPSNPLGKHWIGLEGTEGDAVGREGYGIHGTIEPESIGKAVSLGCIRMHNEDVAFLYQLVMPGQSTVSILP